MPKFITNTTSSLKSWFADNVRAHNNLTATIRCFHSKLLDVQLSFHSSKRRDSIHDFNKFIQLFNNCTTIPVITRKQLTTYLFHNRKSLYEHHTKKKGEKLEKIKRSFLKRNNLVFHDKWFVNLSDVIFPIEFKWLLSLGCKFALPTKIADFPLLDVITDVEECLSLFDDEHQKEVTRATIATILSKNNKNNLSDVDKTILRIHDDCTRFLKKNKHIIIVKADKGGSTVAMKRDDYNTKMIQMLNDATTYERQNHNPVKKLESLSNKLVDKLHGENVIDEMTRRRMTRYNTHLSKIYALPKVHKTNVPLRPIVATVDSPSEVLSIYADGILRCLLSDKYDVKNSLEVKKRLENLYVSRNDDLVSFDIVSLFPSIPIELVWKIIDKKWTVIQNHTSMSKELFFEILKFVLVDATYFDFQGQFYKQINGCAMGSNISPTIANIITDYLLDTVTSKMTIKPKFLVKYVDDIFAVAPRRHVDAMLRSLNSFHSRIQFTMETEVDGKLPYLDLLIIRNNNFLVTDWYRKPTASNNSLSFLSNHPPSMKANVAFNLFHRAIGLSHPSFHNKNIKIVEGILKDNHYPTYVIKNQLHRSLQKLTTRVTIPPSVPPGNPNTIIQRRSLTFNNTTSPTISNVIKSRSNNKIIATAKPYRCLRDTVFSKLKTTTEKLQRTNVIYQIPCNGHNGTSCNESYVGQTKNNLKVRLQQHKNDLRSNNNPNGQSAVVTHFTTKGHSPAFDQVKILANEKISSRRNTQESLHILCERTYNQRRDTQNISASYCSLLERKTKSS